MLKGLFRRVGNLVRGRGTIDEDLMEDLEEALIQADMPAKQAVELVEEARERAERERATDPEDFLQVMRNIIRRILSPYEVELKESDEPPTIYLIVGVNGTGKTTTIAKLAHRFQQQGKSVMMVAADTFRAAAIEQLQIWADRVNCDIVRQELGSDPGAVVYDALEAADARGTDVILIDTAGRLHTEKNLMAELSKIAGVIERKTGEPAHERLLVADATTGQNTLTQGREFDRAVDLTGIILAKLDSSARGGMAVALVQELEVPIKLIGLGEQLEDLHDFSAAEYADALLAE
ncbi:MAG: signal recognition particle-docking protein FtsY [Armatimonadota bacterium]